MAPCSKCNYDDPDLFADVKSIIGVELCWNPSTKWHPTYLLHTVADKVPVMWIGINNQCRLFPAQIRCRAFRGVIRTEWVNGRPPLLNLVICAFREVFGFADSHRRYETLRAVNGHDIIAVYDVFQARSFQDWRSEIIVNGNAYQMRMEHLPARKKVLYNGDRIIVSDQDREVVTAVVDRVRPERGRIMVLREVDVVEAVLSFLFMEARELERDTGD